MHQEPMYTVAELCAVWNVHPKTILGHISRGTLRAVNIAGVDARRPTWRIPAAAVEVFLTTRSAAPAAAPRVVHPTAPWRTAKPARGPLPSARDTIRQLLDGEGAGK
jgi:hypothetical protein